MSTHTAQSDGWGFNILVACICAIVWLGLKFNEVYPEFAKDDEEGDD